MVVVQAPTVFISFAGAQGSRFVLQSFPGWEGTSGLTGAGLFKIRVQGLGFRGFGAHTRTIQARHMVRSLMSETSLRE